jgi:predicted metal-dependent peptidase
MSKIQTLAKASKDLMLKEPFYGLFLISLNKKWDERIPTACVGLNKINTELRINTDFWNGLPPEVQIGILKHELLHIAFFHLTSFSHLLKEDREIANIAMDIEINQYIERYMLPDDPEPQLPSTYPNLNLEEKKGTMYYYEKLKKEKDKNNQDLQAVCTAMMNGEGECTLPSTGETVQVPQHDWEEMLEQMDETTQRLVEAQIGHVIAQVADQVEKSRGTIPGEIKDVLEKILNPEPPKFDWRGYIRRFHGKSIKVYTKKSRRKFNKRTPDFPGLKIKQQKHIFVGVDTSGSVNKEELKEFFQEIGHMHKTGSEVTVCQFDTAIKSLKSFNPRDDWEIHGRGGTDFQPLIDYYNENQQKYSCLMCLTDGEAPAPENAQGNILWVLSSVSQMNEDLPGSVIQLN